MICSDERQTFMLLLQGSQDMFARTTDIHACIARHVETVVKLTRKK